MLDLKSITKLKGPKESELISEKSYKGLLLDTPKTPFVRLLSKVINIREKLDL